MQLNNRVPSCGVPGNRSDGDEKVGSKTPGSTNYAVD